MPSPRRRLALDSVGINPPTTIHPGRGPKKKCVGGVEGTPGPGLNHDTNTTDGACMRLCMRRICRFRYHDKGWFSTSDIYMLLIINTRFLLHCSGLLE